MSIFRPDGALDVRFDLFYDQRWNEIPNEDTRGALAQSGGLGIQRGLPNESGESPPTRCDLSLNNRGGKYSPRNPFSPLFGKLGRNTQLRARVVGNQFETAPTAEVKSLTTDFLIGNVNNVNAPPGLAEGDVLLAFITHPGGQTFAQQALPQGGARWFEIAEVQSFDPSVQPRVAIGRTKVYWKVAGPDEPAQYQFNFDSSPQAALVIVAVQNASHARPQLIAATEPEFATEMTSVSSLPGAPSLELRWVAGHGNFLAAPTATWSAPEGFVEQASFDDIDTNAILASRQLSTLDETGDHVFTVDEPVAFKAAVTVNVLSQDTSSLRATVEVPAWPARWDPSSVNQPVDRGAGDVWVPIEGAGILRRLGQGAKPLRSAMHRVHMGQSEAGFGSANQAHLVAYWPLEEGENAEIGVSPLENVPNARFSGDLNLGDAAPSPGTEDLVSVEDTTGRIRMDVPAFPSDWVITDRWMTGFEFAHDPDAGSGDNVMSFRFVEQHFRWEVFADINASGGLDWEITRADLDDDPPVASTQDTGTGDSAPFYWVEMRKATNTFQVVVNGVTVLSGAIAASDQIGPPTSLEYRILAGADPVLYGHVSVWAAGSGISFDNALPDFLGAIDGYRGERAGRRIERLCAEEDIPFYAVGDLDDTPFMGPQPITEFVDALRDAEEVDIGFLYEPRDQLGISYRTRSSLYSTIPDLILTFGARGEVIQPLEPVDDDQQLRNDVTASRPGGSSARAVQETGPLSIQDPPDGVGLYDVSVSVNVLSDLDLAGQAGFRLALGTVDEARYPVITLDLLALYEYDKFDLFKRATELDVGSRLQVQDPPQWLPPDVIDQFAIGFSEVLTEFGWGITTNNRPARPFTEIGEFEDEEGTPAPDAPGRYDTNGTQTLENFQVNVDTELPIETTSGQLWTTNDGGVLLRGLAGESVCIPDDPILDVTGDLDLRFDGRLFTWNSTPDNQTLIAKYRPSDDNRSYWLLVTAAGQLRLQWTTDGTAGTILNRTASAEIPAGPSERIALRATLDVDDGGDHTVTFYSAPTIAGPWIQLGEPQTASGTTSIFSGDADLCVGSFDGGGALAAGIIHSVEVRDGIDGTVVANPMFEQRASAVFPEVVDTQGTVSTALTTSHLVQMPSTVEEDDVLVVVLEFGRSGEFPSNPAIPSGWTFFGGVGAGSGSAFTRFTVWARVADGTEGGTTVDFVTTNACRFAAITARIQNALPDLTNGISGSGTHSSGGGSPDPPGVTADWGVDSNLFLVLAGWGDDAGQVVSFPAAYSGVQAHADGGTNASISASVAFRQLSASGDDPGAYTLSDSEVNSATTLAIRPSSSSIVEFTDDAGNEWSVTGLVNGDLPLDVNLASVQLRVTDIEYMRPFLVDVQSVASGTTGSFTVPAPTGLQEGDLLVAFHATDVGSESSGTISGGSFWTDIGRQASADGSGRVAVFAKIAGPSEPSSYTVTQDSGADGVAAIAAVRDVRSTPRVIAHIQGFTGSSTSIETPPSNPIAQSFELRWASSESGATYTPPSGFDEQADLDSGGFVGGTLVTRHVRSLQTGRHDATASGSVVDRIGVTVNAIGTQVMTVEQQGINAPVGATKLVAAGESVALWTPTRYGL